MTHHPGFKTPPLTIDKVKSIPQAESNCLYMHPSVYSRFVDVNDGKEPVYGQVNNFVFILKEEISLPETSLGIPAVIRNSLKLSPTLDSPIVSWYDMPKEQFMLGTVKMQVTCPTLKPDDKVELAEEIFIKVFREKFRNHFIGTGQEFYLNLDVRFGFIAES
jgi:hypothetical protein